MSGAEGDFMYVVETGDWSPSARPNDLTVEEIYGVLAKVPEFYPAAMASLIRDTERQENDDPR